MRLVVGDIFKEHEDGIVKVTYFTLPGKSLNQIHFNFLKKTNGFEILFYVLKLKNFPLILTIFYISLIRDHPLID